MRRAGWLPILLCSFGGMAGAQQPPSLSSASLREMPTPELARLLVPQHSARISSHQVVPPHLPGGSPAGVRFFAEAEPARGGICRRDTYYAGLSSSSAGSGEVRLTGINRRVQIALAGDCRQLSDAAFAHLQPASTEQGATAALRWLAAARAMARKRAPLPFSVTCRTAGGADRCSAGARTVLANLLLEKTYLIEPVRGEVRGWKMAVMPSGAGQAYWNVFIGSGSNGEAEVTMTWDVPAPF